MDRSPAETWPLAAEQTAVLVEACPAGTHPAWSRAVRHLPPAQHARPQPRRGGQGVAVGARERAVPEQEAEPVGDAGAQEPRRQPWAADERGRPRRRARRRPPATVPPHPQPARPRRGQLEPATASVSVPATTNPELGDRPRRRDGPLRLQHEQVRPRLPARSPHQRRHGRGRPRRSAGPSALVPAHRRAEQRPRRCANRARAHDRRLCDARHVVAPRDQRHRLLRTRRHPHPRRARRPDIIPDDATDRTAPFAPVRRPGVRSRSAAHLPHLLGRTVHRQTLRCGTVVSVHSAPWPLPPHRRATAGGRVPPPAVVLDQPGPGVVARRRARGAQDEGDACRERVERAAAQPPVPRCDPL